MAFGTLIIEPMLIKSESTLHVLRRDVKCGGKHGRIVLEVLKTLTAIAHELFRR